MMEADKLTTLRAVNGNIRSALTRLRPDQKHCSDIEPQDFSDLLGEIVRAAECLRGQAAPSEAMEFAQASLEYRTNLEKLREFLPQLHGNLLAEKARLETARAQVAAAAAWAQASTRTL
jgi:hypothetical protein